MADNEYTLVWVMGKLAFAFICILEDDGKVEGKESIECLVNLDCYVADNETIFASIHPCALRRCACTKRLAGGRSEDTRTAL